MPSLYAENSRDLPLPLSADSRPVSLTRELFQTYAGIRQSIKEHAERADFVPGRVDDLVTAASEAMMNAIVHGGDASVAASSNQDQVQVRVTDGGQGIDWEVLPQATLRGGWSCKGTLGMGFTLILETIDHMDLYTSPSGTTIVLTMDRIRRPPARFEMDAVQSDLINRRCGIRATTKAALIRDRSIAEQIASWVRPGVFHWWEPTEIACLPINPFISTTSKSLPVTCPNAARSSSFQRRSAVPAQAPSHLHCRPRSCRRF